MFNVSEEWDKNHNYRKYLYLLTIYYLNYNKLLTNTINNSNNNISKNNNIIINININKKKIFFFFFFFFFILN